MKLTFTIPGQPIPKGRPRLGRGNRVFTPQRTLDHEAKWAQAAHTALRQLERWPMAAEYAVHTHFVLGTKRAVDLDNLFKCADGLNGVAFYDDSMVAEIRATREYDKAAPRTEVTITVLAELTDDKAAACKAAHEAKLTRRAARKAAPKRPAKRATKATRRLPRRRKTR